MSRPSSGAAFQSVEGVFRRSCESDKRRRKEAKSAKTRKVVVKLWRRVQLSEGGGRVETMYSIVVGEGRRMRRVGGMLRIMN